MKLRDIFNKRKITTEGIYSEVEEYVLSMEPQESLKFLFDLDTRLYLLQGRESIRYGDGEHSKHRHINYHKFFQDNINQGDNVLDVGSSFGELTSDIAKAAAPGEVVGVEIGKPKVDEANKKYKVDNLSFIFGDITRDEIAGNFNVITMSNVLEHIENRVELLQDLTKKYSPEKFIIRVPSFERDWRVPLKKELGIDYRLDDTHFIEYTLETFKKEMSDSGLKIVSMRVAWGEIWAVLELKS